MRKTRINAFFCACKFYGGCAWEGFVPTGLFGNGSTGRSTRVPPSPIFDRVSDGFKINKGTIVMHTRLEHSKFTQSTLCQMGLSPKTLLGQVEGDDDE